MDTSRLPGLKLIQQNWSIQSLCGSKELRCTRPSWELGRLGLQPLRSNGVVGSPVAPSVTSECDPDRWGPRKIDFQLEPKTNEPNQILWMPSVGAGSMVTVSNIEVRVLSTDDSDNEVQ